jgi:hypothetical protein
MMPQSTIIPEDFDEPLDIGEGDEDASEEVLWYLPGPIEEEPDYRLPGPRAGQPEKGLIDDWARVAGRLGALDDRLARAPKGWLHRLALIEAADLSWFAGERSRRPGSSGAMDFYAPVRRTR